MDPLWIFFFVILAVIGIIGFVGWQMEKKRTQDLSTLSATLGMSFVAKSMAGNPLSLSAPALAFFKTGYGQRSRNHLQKTLIDQTQVHVFDYQYTTGSGKSRTVHQITVFAALHEDWRLPAFRLHPEIPIFHNIAKVFGMQDINFPTHPEFSRIYLLRGEQEDPIRRLFERGLLSFFERHPQWCVEAAGSLVILWRQDRRISPREVPGFLAFGQDLCQRLQVSAGY
jgi:hypothetical protein